MDTLYAESPCRPLDEKGIFVRVAQNEKDKKELQTLITETRAISEMTDKCTGLFIGDVFQQKDFLYVMLVLNKRLKISQKELAALRLRVLEHHHDKYHWTLL